jgi:hypothetical protein
MTAKFSAASNTSLCWALLGLALSGCGSGEARGRVAGKVTFQGQAVSEGIVVFNNDEKGIHMTAKLESDGSYEIITAKGVGVSVGTYRVCVCPPLPALPPMSAGNPPTTTETKQYPNIPQKYRNPATSGLNLTVKQGENPFDIAMQP